MYADASLAERAQAALDAWVHALSRWNDDLPSSSLPSAALDKWNRGGEIVDLLYRRWRALADEVSSQVERNLEG